MFFYLLFLLGTPPLVSANSRGIGVPCNVNVPVGSDDVNTKSSNSMWWAKKTTWANNAYTLRSGDGNKGDDPTVYIPGEWTSLYLRSNVQGKQIAGLVLYAEKYKTGTKVGEWSFPANSGFHQPGDCVVHQNADFKKYLNVFKVRIPAGSGEYASAVRAYMLECVQP